MFGKLFALGRSRLNEAVDGIADANAIPLLEQQIKDSEASLGKARHELATLTARRTLAQRRHDEVETKFTQYQEAGKGAMAKGDEQLARDVAEQLAILYDEGQKLKEEIADLEAAEARNGEILRRMTEQIAQVKREISTVRATAAIHKAQQSISSNASGTSGQIESAMTKLHKIKEGQAVDAAQIEADQKVSDALSGRSLDKRLADAGLISGGRRSAESFLASFSEATPKIEGPSTTAALPPPASTDTTRD